MARANPLGPDPKPQRVPLSRAKQQERAWKAALRGQAQLVAEDAVRRQLRARAELDLQRILVSHGAPIENPRETLRELAAA